MHEEGDERDPAMRTIAQLRLHWAYSPILVKRALAPESRPLAYARTFGFGTLHHKRADKSFVLIIAF